MGNPTAPLEFRLGDLEMPKSRLLRFCVAEVLHVIHYLPVVY